jgi:nicotinate dehydrogenase subunit B
MRRDADEAGMSGQIDGIGDDGGGSVGPGSSPRQHGHGIRDAERETATITSAGRDLMAPVVRELAGLPDQDIRAMAVYLGSFNENAIDKPDEELLAARLDATTATGVVSAPAIGARLYEGACAVCHRVGGPPLFGSRPSLALNSNLPSTAPHNLIQIILHGIAAPTSSDLGYMPAFKDSMTDQQVAELVSYLRQQFAPEKPP